MIVSLSECVFRQVSIKTFGPEVIHCYFLLNVFCTLFCRISNHNHFTMHEQLPDDIHLAWQLNRLNKTQTIAAIGLLQQRLDLMEGNDYYLSIPLTALPIPPGIQTHMQSHEIYTVRDLLLQQPDKLRIIRGVGEKNLKRLQKMIAVLEEKKDQLKNMTAEELYAIIDHDEGL